MNNAQSSYIGVDPAREHVIKIFLTDVSLGDLTHIPISVFDAVYGVRANPLAAASIFRQFNICVFRLQHCERLKTLVPIHPELEKRVEEEFRELKDEIERQKLKGPLDLAFRNLKSHKEYKRKKHFFNMEFFEFVNAQLYDFIYHLKWQRPNNRNENGVVEFNFINLPQNLLDKIGKQFDDVSNQAYDFHLIDVKDVNWENGPTVTHFNRISYYSRLYHIIVDHHTAFVSRMEDDLLGNMEVLSTIIYHLRILDGGEFAQRYLSKNLGPKLKNHNLKDTDTLTIEFIRKTQDIFFNERPLLVSFVQQYVLFNHRENGQKLGYLEAMQDLQHTEVRNDAARHRACPRYNEMNVLNIMRDFDEGIAGAPVDDSLAILRPDPNLQESQRRSVTPAPATTVPELELMRAMHRASLNDQIPPDSPIGGGAASAGHINTSTLVPTNTGPQISNEVTQSRSLREQIDHRSSASNVQQQAAAAALRRQQQPRPGVRRPRPRPSGQQPTDQEQTPDPSQASNLNVTRQVFEQTPPTQNRLQTETEYLNDLFGSHVDFPLNTEVVSNNVYTLNAPLFTSVPYENQAPQTVSQSNITPGERVVPSVVTSYSDVITSQIPQTIRDLTAARRRAAETSRTTNENISTTTPQTEHPPVLRPPVFRAPSGDSSTSQQPVQIPNVTSTTNAPSGDNVSRRAWSPPPWVRRENNGGQSQQPQSITNPEEQNYDDIPPPPEWMLRRNGVPPNPLQVLTSIDDISSEGDGTTQTSVQGTSRSSAPPFNPFTSYRRPQSSGGRCRPPERGPLRPHQSDDDDSPYPLGSRRQPVTSVTGIVSRSENVTTEPSGQRPSDHRGRPAPERRQQSASIQTQEAPVVLDTNNTNNGAEPEIDRLTNFLDAMKRTNWETVQEYLNAIEEDRQRREAQREHVNLLLPESHVGTASQINNTFVNTNDGQNIPIKDTSVSTVNRQTSVTEESQRQRPSPKAKPKSLRDYRRRDPVTGLGRSYTDGSTTTDSDSADNSWSDESRRPRRRTGSTLIRPSRLQSTDDDGEGKVKATRKSPRSRASGNLPQGTSTSNVDLTELAGMASLNLKSPSPRTKLGRSSSLRGGSSTRDAQQTSSSSLTRSASFSSRSSNPFMPKPPESGRSSDGTTGSQTSVSTFGTNTQQCRFRMKNADKMFTIVNGKPRLPRIRSAWYSSDDGGDSGLECLRTPAVTRKPTGKGGKISVDVKKIMATTKGSQQAKQCLDTIINHSNESARYALKQPTQTAGSITSRSAPIVTPRGGVGSGNTRSSSQDRRSGSGRDVPTATDLIDISSAPSSLIQQTGTGTVSTNQNPSSDIQLFSVPPASTSGQAVQQASSIPLKPIVVPSPISTSTPASTSQDSKTISEPAPKPPIVSNPTFNHVPSNQPSSSDHVTEAPQDDPLREFIAQLEGTDVPTTSVPEQSKSTGTSQIDSLNQTSTPSQQTTSSRKSSKTNPPPSSGSQKSGATKLKSSVSDSSSAKTSTRKGSPGNTADTTKSTKKVSINDTETKKVSKAPKQTKSSIKQAAPDNENILLNARVVTLDGNNINIGNQDLSVFAPRKEPDHSDTQVRDIPVSVAPNQNTTQQTVTNIFAPIRQTDPPTTHEQSSKQHASAASLASNVIPEAVDIFLTPDQRAALGQPQSQQQNVIPEAVDIFLTPDQRAALGQPQSQQQNVIQEGAAIHQVSTPHRRVVSSFAEQIAQLPVDQLKILRGQLRQRISDTRQQESPMDVDRRHALDSLEAMMISDESTAPTPLHMDLGGGTPTDDVDMS
ncbi:ORF-C [Elephant endotheliotropic herpesvirus 6]|nr:ORF-C [Elephant endotheliotropic herpesvirus 6]UEH20601.1 ORF-C [Elephant endotheliotropic herpesvirus 6]